jgi:hypothetical protein
MLVKAKVAHTQPGNRTHTARKARSSSTMASPISMSKWSSNRPKDNDPEERSSF